MCLSGAFITKIIFSRSSFIIPVFLIWFREDIDEMMACTENVGEESDVSSVHEDEELEDDSKSEQEANLLMRPTRKMIQVRMSIFWT